MAHVHIPALLRAATAGRVWLEAPGATVGEVVAGLEELCPELRGRLVCEGRLVRGMAIAVDGEISSMGLLEPVDGETEVQFIAAISGG